MVFWWTRPLSRRQSLKLNRRTRRRNRKLARVKVPRSASRYQLERLEPRVLLSADPAIVSVTIQSPTGYNIGALYSDMAGASGQATGATHDSTPYAAVHAARGLSLALQGSNFTYDASGNLVGGTLNALQISDLSSNPVARASGFAGVGAANFYNALTANAGGDRSQLDAIFNS